MSRNRLTFRKLHGIVVNNNVGSFEEFLIRFSLEGYETDRNSLRFITRFCIGTDIANEYMTSVYYSRFQFSNRMSDLYIKGSVDLFSGLADYIKTIEPELDILSERYLNDLRNSNDPLISKYRPGRECLNRLIDIYNSRNDKKLYRLYVDNDIDIYNARRDGDLWEEQDYGTNGNKEEKKEEETWSFRW